MSNYAKCRVAMFFVLAFLLLLQGLAMRETNKENLLLQEELYETRMENSELRHSVVIMQAIIHSNDVQNDPTY